MPAGGVVFVQAMSPTTPKDHDDHDRLTQVHVGAWYFEGGVHASIWDAHESFAKASSVLASAINDPQHAGTKRAVLAMIAAKCDELRVSIEAIVELAPLGPRTADQALWLSEIDKGLHRAICEWVYAAHGGWMNVTFEQIENWLANTKEIVGFLESERRHSAACSAATRETSDGKCPNPGAP